MLLPVPDGLAAVLKFLGRFDWLRFHSSDTEPPSTDIKWGFPSSPDLHGLGPDLDRLRPIFRRSPECLPYMFALSKALAYGPKILRPSHEQCEALGHVDIHVGFEEYEQPFPVFFVEIPESFRRLLNEQYGSPCTSAIIASHDPSSRTLFISTAHAETFTLLSPRAGWRTIEEALRVNSVKDGPDLRLGHHLYRLALNFGLLLTRYGAKLSGPVDPGSWEKYRLAARRKKGRKAERFQGLLDRSFQQIDFGQKVIFKTTMRPQSPSSANPELVGSSRRPHWRRGHFRSQRCGMGRSQRKLIFVRPTFVNGTLFGGDIGDTHYEIEGRGS